MNPLEKHLLDKLIETKQELRYRSLLINKNLIDFCSNDYLGFAQSINIKKKCNILLRQQNYKNGATGSRLISGNSTLAENLEQKIANFHHAEAALLFNSGYDANIGFFSSILTRHDTILYDQLAHASIRDGIRLSHARSFVFKHNDPLDLEKKLQQAKGHVIVVVESIYSMDGDAAPLAALIAVAKKYKAAVVVDEAHGLGVVGQKGEGLVVKYGLEKEVFARIYTYGKAMGAHGAVIVGSQNLRAYLINFARSFIYTTALPPHSLAMIQAAYEALAHTPAIAQLQSNIELFKSHLDEPTLARFLPSNSSIQCLLLPDNKAVKALAERIKAAGFFVKAILHPTVPKGQERIRICIHAFNTETEIKGLCKVLLAK